MRTIVQLYMEKQSIGAIPPNPHTGDAERSLAQKLLSSGKMSAKSQETIMIMAGFRGPEAQATIVNSMPPAMKKELGELMTFLGVPPQQLPPAAAPAVPAAVKPQKGAVGGKFSKGNKFLRRAGALGAAGAAGLGGYYLYNKYKAQG